MAYVVRFLADVACVLLVLAGHVIALPLAAWRAWREGITQGSRAADAALLWDLMLAQLLGADRGETVSTWAQRSAPGCWLCRLLSVRWPKHCEESAGVRFDVRRV